MKKLILVAISLLVAHYLHLAVASAGWVTSRRKQFTLGFAAACLSLSVITAHAWDGSATGSIVAIGGVASAGGAPGNLDVRVYLGNQSNMCTGAVDPT